MGMAIALTILRRNVKGRGRKSQPYKRRYAVSVHPSFLVGPQNHMSPIGNCIAKQGKHDNDETRRGPQERHTGPILLPHLQRRAAETDNMVET